MMQKDLLKIWVKAKSALALYKYGSLVAREQIHK